MAFIYRKSNANHSCAWFAAFAVCLFALMFLCNLLTGLCVDDFSYLNSFATSERIDSVLDIFPSLATHAHTMNGRLISHFFVQLFLYLPLWVFKIVNTLMFLALLILIYRLSSPQGKPDNMLFLSLFAMVWIFTPAFGQVCFWLTGACNYLWSVVFGLVFLLPFIKKYLYDRPIRSWFLRLLFVVFAFIVGGYMENTSAAVIFAGALLTLLASAEKRYRISLTQVFALLAALGGFTFMAMQPAELEKKVGSFRLGDLRIQFITALKMLKTFWPLFVLFAVLFVIACRLHTPRDRRVLAGVLMLSSLASNFMLTFASYYPERIMLPAVIFAITACGILMGDILQSPSEYQTLIRMLMAGLYVVAAYQLLLGMNDIFTTYALQRDNIAILAAARESGTLDVRLPMIAPVTKYSALYDLKYLDSGDTGSWPNAAMAAYYKVKTILGFYP